jgi:hypothetical protein
MKIYIKILGPITKIGNVYLYMCCLDTKDGLVKAKHLNFNCI